MYELTQLRIILLDIYQWDVSLRSDSAQPCVCAKGLTIYDLGGAEIKLKMNLFFCMNAFFPDEGPPKIFFLISSGPTISPSSLMVVL